MTTLREALEMFDGQILSDGAQNWDQENYLEETEQSDDGQEFLAQEVYVSESGIFQIDSSGYIGAAILTVAEDDPR